MAWMVLPFNTETFGNWPGIPQLTRRDFCFFYPKRACGNYAPDLMILAVSFLKFLS